MRGLQLVAEFYQCRAAPQVLERAQVLAELCRQEVDNAGLRRLGDHFHQFEPAGVTGSLVLAESHLNVHTWPEFQSVSLDIYVCNLNTDNRAKAYRLYQALARHFLPGSQHLRELERGAPDGRDEFTD